MLKKPKSPFFCPAWYVQVAEGMVRNNISLKESALDLNIQLDPDELQVIERRKEFQEILRAEQNKYYAAVANDPTRTKSTVLGKLVVQAEFLHKQGDYDKAAIVLEKVAKIEGWTGSDQNINVFGGLTARDIAEAKERLSKESIPSSGPISPSYTN